MSLPTAPRSQEYPLSLMSMELVLANLLEATIASVLIGIFYSVTILGIVNAVHLLPGHEKGGLWPIYVKSHSSVQTSQNLFDPYSISHASHGVIGYLAASWFGLDLGGGLIVAIVSASLWEMLENTNLIINQFRENSGTSESYEGDSRINVVGDVISCATGYTLAHVGHEVAGPWFPFAWLVASELVLAVTIRDNMLLMALQLIAPSETIKHWQQEIISPSSETFSIQKPKSTRYGKLVLQKTVNRNL